MYSLLKGKRVSGRKGQFRVGMGNTRVKKVSQWESFQKLIWLCQKHIVADRKATPWIWWQQYEHQKE